MSDLLDAIDFDLPNNWIDDALQFSARRMRICKQAPACPKCRTRQVQLINQLPLAEWKCRHCKHKWRFEPLVSNAAGNAP